MCRLSPLLLTFLLWATVYVLLSWHLHTVHQSLYKPDTPGSGPARGPQPPWGMPEFHEDGRPDRATFSAQPTGPNRATSSAPPTRTDRATSPAPPTGPDKRLCGDILQYLQIPEYSRIWPEPDEREDRILNQLYLCPENVSDSRMRVILAYDRLPQGTEEGTVKFEKDQCPIQNCRLTNDKTEIQKADAVIFYRNNLIDHLRNKKHPNQIWILATMESPWHAAFPDLENTVNWTATYRVDSTISTPYGQFLPYQNATYANTTTGKNYAQGKSKMAAWFVSNCFAHNGREKYASELSKYIQVGFFI